MPNHYSTYAYPILCLIFLGFVLWQLASCSRLITKPEQKRRLLSVFLWVMFIASVAFSRFSESIRRDQRLSEEFLVYFGPLFVIQTLLDLVKALLNPA